MNAVTFAATLLQKGKTATGVVVPDSVVEELNSGRRPAVTVTIKGHSYPSTVANMGGTFMLPVSAENRAAAGVSAGDELEVTLVLDTKPREVTVPDDFAAALAAEPAAQRFFQSLSYSNQRWHVLSVEGAKTAETRQRRIDKSLGLLRAGKGR